MELFSRAPSGYLRSRTLKNSLAVLLWAAVLLVIYVLYMRSAWVYVRNAQSSGFPLDTGELLSEVEVVTIRSTAGNVKEGIVGYSVPASVPLDMVYVDSNDHYRFKVTVESFEEIGKLYSLSSIGTFLTIDNPANPSKAATADTIETYAVMTIGGINFLAVLPDGLAYSPGDVAENVLFSVLSADAGNDLGKTDFAGLPFADRMIDLRGMTVDSEGNDFFLAILFSVIFPLFFVYALLTLPFPRIHPNYLLLSRHSDVDRASLQIDDDIRSGNARKEKRTIYTDHFIIKQTWYTTQISKNHTVRH